MEGGLDLNHLGLYMPLWSIVTGGVGLISFGMGLAWLGFNVRQSIQSNIVQNNENHRVQMDALQSQNDLLRKIICLTRLQLTAIGDPHFKYRRQCEDEYS